MKSEKPKKRASHKDDPSKRGTPDNDLISMTQPHEVRYWTQHFGVSRDELQDAIDATKSHSVKVIENYLSDTE